MRTVQIVPCRKSTPPRRRPAFWRQFLYQEGWRILELCSRRSSRGIGGGCRVYGGCHLWGRGVRSNLGTLGDWRDGGGWNVVSWRGVGVGERGGHCLVERRLWGE